ncbi:MAG: hypothetical protein QOE41_547 [Mycobacterium sp.]|nr:hypothetical protein [Mycobacterium sp.]
MRGCAESALIVDPDAGFAQLDANRDPDALGPAEGLTTQAADSGAIIRPNHRVASPDVSSGVSVRTY